MEVVRQKNVSTYITFPIVDADGDFVTGAAGLDSEIDTFADATAPDGFTDCTNEASEIGSTGIYKLQLTQAEMNFDYIVIQVKTSTSGAKTQMILIRTMVGDVLNIATTDDGGTINVDSGKVDAQVKAIDAGAITAAVIADSAIDIATFAADCKTGSYLNAQVKGQDNIDFGALQKASLNAATPASVVGAVGSIASGGITAASIATNAIDADAIATDAITEIQNGLATATALASVKTDTGTTIPAAIAAVQSDTDNIQTRLPAALVGGKMDSTATITGTVDSNVVSIATDAITAASIKTDAITEIQNGLATSASISALNNLSSAQAQTAAAAAITAAALATSAALATVQADTDDIQAKLAIVDGTVDDILVDTGTTASLAAYDPPTNAELTAGVERVKDTLLNKTVISRHANKKPSQYSAGTLSNAETVNTTIDVDGNIETETQV
jgi:hypothetical protein